MSKIFGLASAALALTLVASMALALPKDGLNRGGGGDRTGGRRIKARNR